MAPESDLSIAPDATRSTQMMWFSNLLSRTEYGFILKNEQGDMFQEFMDLLAARKARLLSYKLKGIPNPIPNNDNRNTDVWDSKK
jgi:hypothetical protein